MNKKLVEVMIAWNNQADEYNGWDVLSSEEKLEFTIHKFYFNLIRITS